MNAKTDTVELRDVASSLVGQYASMNKHLLNAWRIGATRIIGGTATGYSKVTENIPFIGDELKAKAIDAQSKVRGFLVGRVESNAALVERAVDTVSERTNGGIQYLAQASDRVNNTVGTNVLRTLRAVQLPIAKLQLKVADTLVTGAEKIESGVSTIGTGKNSVVEGVAKTARRAARRVADAAEA